MLYRIRHTTEYVYASRVSHCYNMAHVTPRNTPRQECLSSRVDVLPGATYSSTRTDYFGNSAYHFEIQKPHKKLVITSVSEVRTGVQAAAPDLEFGISCKDAREAMQALAGSAETLFAREYLMDSAMIKATPELAEFAADLFTDDKPLLTAVMELTSRIFNDFEYSPASTTIATPLADVLANRKGVCQDFAHLQIAILRSLGFAARYVSGYLETLPPPGQVKMVGADATHAWLAVYVPDEGWFEYDPTNNCMAHEQHVVTAWGRDFYDVTPLCGVIYGGGQNPVLRVAVDVTRLG
ncbi:transglutaminase family protein [Oceanobacter mangrovi]|uniref:transglutaminase family protein n=1 Tax=Oceanobacter mangrovi TaxID=2862510 RepID=UPI001C8D3005|nr:transglutaminase family protein [Oceanobacter mangrovi]